MRRTLLGCLFAVLVVLPSLALAQQIRVVRVGVVAEQYLDYTTRVNWTSNARWQRDLLVTYLNRHKPSKTDPFKLEAVALTTTSYRGVDPEARVKGCEYVVHVWNHSSAVHGPENPSVYAAENSFQPEPYLPGNLGSTSYSVGYSLARVSDGFWVAGDSYTQQQPPSAPAMLVMSSVYDAIVRAATP